MLQVTLSALMVFAFLAGCKRQATENDVIGQWSSDSGDITLTISSRGSMRISGGLERLDISLSNGSYSGNWSFTNLSGRQYLLLEVDSSSSGSMKKHIGAQADIGWRGDSAVLYFSIGDPDDLNRVYLNRREAKDSQPVIQGSKSWKYSLDHFGGSCASQNGVNVPKYAVRP